MYVLCGLIVEAPLVFSNMQDATRWVPLPAPYYSLSNTIIRAGPPRVTSVNSPHASSISLSLSDVTTRAGSIQGMGSNKVTVTKFLQLLMILELYLELSYFLSQIFKVVNVTEVTEVPKFVIQK